MSMTNMFRDSLINSIDGISREVSTYAREADIWAINGSVTNSAGTLSLHLIGSMNHFIGATLGNTGYVRDRAAEFSQRNVPRDVILSNIAEVREMINHTFSLLKDADLENIYPLTTFGEGRTTASVLMLLCAHASYHLGQVNYLRRTLDGVLHG